MFDWLIEPRTLVLLAAVALGTMVVGRMRHESRVTIAANTIGGVATLAGMLWAGDLGLAAFGAAVLVGIGLYLMTTTYERDRAARKLRDQSDAAGHAGVAR